jgi:hypothetical protein
MRQTAKDMNSKYKETSEGRLKIAVNMILWCDLGFYSIGVLIAYSFDSFLVKTQNTNLK